MDEQNDHVSLSDLLEQARAEVGHLTANLPTAVDPRAFLPWTTSKAPFIAMCLREAQTLRAEEFARAACDMFERDDVVVGVSNTRAVAESFATVWCLMRRIEGIIKDNAAPSEIYDELRQLFLGSKTNEDLPTARNVLGMLDKADKDFPGIRRSYDLMSEFAHPNYDGAAGVFGRRDGDTMVWHCGKGLRDTAYPKELGLKSLIASIGALKHAYNRIGDKIEAFSLVCERSLKEGG